MSLPAAATHNTDRHQNLDLLFESGPTGAVNSDLAFWGNLAYQGHYNGFRVFDLTDPSNPVMIEDFPCEGPQNDPVVFRNLLFLAVDRTMTGPDCSATQTMDHDDPNGWEGVRIFNVSDPTNPQFITGVYTDCGAHTITLWPKNKKEILLYVSSYPLRPGPTCGQTRGPEAGRDPNHGVIQVLRVPLGNPAATSEIAEPKITYPGDSDNLFVPAEHGLPGPPALEPSMRACHDIGVFVDLRLAAGACAEQGQLWRVKKNGIPNTAKPLWVYDDEVDETGITGDPADPGVKVDFWHSATFSWDGSVINFIDESFGEGCPPVTAGSATKQGDTGRMFFLNTKTGKLLSMFSIPRTESTSEFDYCSAHLGAPVLSPDRDLLVNAWYMGGVDVIDFTNPGSPTEVAHYDQAPFGDDGSDNWSAYWYQGPSVPPATPRALEPQTSFPLYATDGIHDPPSGEGFESYRVNVGANVLGLAYSNPQTQELVPECRGKPATQVGSVLNDVLTGTPGRDVIAAGPGKDRILGLKGKDLICAGKGKDKVSGGGGKDRIFGEGGKDNLRGGGGKDRLNGGPGKKDRCHGGPGKDKAHKSCEKELQV